MVFADESQLPWAGAAIGIVIGVVLVFADQFFTKVPSVKVHRIIF